MGYEEEEPPMSQTAGIHWGRWAAFAGGVMLVRGALWGTVQALTFGRDEVFYRAVEAAERIKHAT